MYFQSSTGQSTTLTGSRICLYCSSFDRNDLKQIHMRQIQLRWEVGGVRQAFQPDCSGQRQDWVSWKG